LPIAVKNVRQEENLPEIKSPDKKSRYCYLSILAVKGFTFKLTPENIAYSEWRVNVMGKFGGDQYESSLACHGNR
jgi:hypothetical protein